MSKDDVKYVQLEPGAFLADLDFQMMTAEERGVYCSVIFYLYTNGGKLALKNHQTPSLITSENRQIAMLSNSEKTGTDFEKIWNNIKKKFLSKNGVLTHKRVTRELKNAYNYKKQKRLAGIKGMQHRYNTVNNTVITNKRQNNKSKGNINKNKNNKGISPLNFFDFVALTNYIQEKLNPRTKFENNGYAQLLKFLQEKTKTEGDGIYLTVKELVDQAIKNGKKPKAYFVWLVKEKFGYEPVGYSFENKKRKAIQSLLKGNTNEALKPP